MLDFDTGTPTREIAQKLRHAVGQRVSRRLEDEDFLNLMLTWALQERATPDEWHDGWSPSQVLAESGFGFVLDLENIRAVGNVDPGDPSSLVVVGRSGPDDVSVPVENGMWLLKGLRDACSKHLSVMGNHHWGTVTDIAMLSESLNLGFMVISNKAQQRQAQGARWMFGLNVERADFPYWMTLYNIDLTHFQLLACSGLDDGADGTSVFPAADVPLALRNHWNFCSERFFGSGSQGGVS